MKLGAQWKKKSMLFYRNYPKQTSDRTIDVKGAAGGDSEGNEKHVHSKLEERASLLCRGRKLS